jgi:hypothetical protein
MTDEPVTSVPRMDPVTSWWPGRGAAVPKQATVSRLSMSSVVATEK